MCTVLLWFVPGAIADVPRFMHGSPVAFLSARSLPVDSYKIRNSLFDTVCTFMYINKCAYTESVGLQQLLRTPAQAAVNIIEKEDVAAMQDEAKYAGMRSEIGRLRADLEL